MIGVRFVRSARAYRGSVLGCVRSQDTAAGARRHYARAGRGDKAGHADRPGHTDRPVRVPKQARRHEKGIREHQQADLQFQPVLGRESSSIVYESLKRFKERVVRNEVLRDKNRFHGVYKDTIYLNNSYLRFQRDVVRELNGSKVGSRAGESAAQAPVPLETLLDPELEQLPAIFAEVLAARATGGALEQFCELRQAGSTPSERIEYFLEETFSKYHSRSREIVSGLVANKQLDLSRPHEWYPQARKLRRKIIMHVGPTNSGKTHRALQRLRETQNGYFAGPLRLLGREVYERFKSEGVRCNLVTGESIINDYDDYGNEATLSSGTIEMISYNHRYDVVVLDEIQMLGDEFRGHSWTNALLGVQAKEIHLCGEVSSVPLIKKIVQLTGDVLEINEYQRLGRLEVARQPLAHGLQSLQKGDCIVAFSKKRILAYKELIRNNTQLKCAVVYGSLPAETRNQEALKFNTGECDVLVASDAIGMGLNLSIKRVIFDQHTKFDGSTMRELTVSQVKQIAGRAGRFKVAPRAGSRLSNIDELSTGHQHSTGYVTAFYFDTLKFLEKQMSSKTEDLETAVVAPTDELLSVFISDFGQRIKLSDTFKHLVRLNEGVNKKSTFGLPSFKGRIDIVEALDSLVKLLLRDELTISTAPVAKHLKYFDQIINNYSKTVSKGRQRTIFDFQGALPIYEILKLPSLPQFLDLHEEFHKYLLLFMWLSNRYPNYFVDRESVEKVKDLLELKIEDMLKDRKVRRIGGVQDDDDRLRLRLAPAAGPGPGPGPKKSATLNKRATLKNSKV